MTVWPRTALAGVLLLGACGEPAAGGVSELSPRAVPPETSTDYALQFDGVRQYASTANSEFPKANIHQSIALWIKPESNAGDQAIVTLRRGTESGTQLGVTEGRLRVWSVWGPRVFTESEPLELDRWVHVAFVQIEIDAAAGVYDHRLYLDGQLVAQGTLIPQVRTPTSSWLGSFDGFSAHYDGWLDEVSVYARALSDAEVLELARDRAVSERDLKARWTFNEAPDSVVAYDRSGHDNHATLGDGEAVLMPERVESDRRD